MMGTAFTLATAPLLPWWAIAALGGLSLLIVAFGIFRRARGVLWRALAILVLLTTLVNPSLVEEKRDPQKDVALIVADESPSQRIGERTRITEAAVAQVEEKLRQQKDLEVRVVRAAKPGEGTALADKGTQLFTAMNRALADVPRQRIAGVAMVTDGQVHDVPEGEARQLGFPLHALLSGQPNEGDRRIIVNDAPSFGLVGKELQLTVRVEDLPEAPQAERPQRVRLTMKKDGGQPTTSLVPVGREITLGVPIDHGGPNVVELEVEAGPRELTLDNNRAALVVNGVRDRLRVLLVSGEPHAGERTWRNILKSDPQVDLVHFTILRPPEKQDGTPIRELSLIAFPIRELFDVKLDEFDLIIFDRYRRRSVIPNAYVENVVRYVRKGGALLEAAGPNFGTPLSLYRTPLGAILPAEPTGTVFEQGFKPKITDVGNRHPVTADLPGNVSGKEPSWGRWFRHVESKAHRGNTIMSGIEGEPLLVLDRAGEGRVAQLLSDHMWLWTRGFEGGGPQAELLRRLAYWLMKEPDLEENDLRATVEGDRLTIIRRSLEKDDRPVRVTGPDGIPREVTLNPDTGGRSIASMPVAEPGLYRVTDGQRTALAAAGALNPIELSDVRTTADKLSPVVTASGGGSFWIGAGALPEIRRVGLDRSAAGRSWMGFRANGDYVVTGVTDVPLLPAFAALLLALGTLVAAWRREGR